MDLHKKRIVITGAASGIGATLMKKLLTHECNIVAADKDSSAWESSVETTNASQAKVYSFIGNLSSQQTVDDLFEFAITKMGGIDIFFANAGFGYYEMINDADWKHIEDIFRVNVFSVIYATEKMRSINHNREYRVVITSSTAGRIAMAGYALYGSTKAALDRFAEGYRMDIRENHSLVLVYPLAVKTSFCKNAGDAPLAWPRQDPDQVADAIIKGIIKDKSDIYTSKLLRVMLLISHNLPFTKRLYQTMESIRFQKWLNKGREQ